MVLDRIRRRGGLCALPHPVNPLRTSAREPLLQHLKRARKEGEGQRPRPRQAEDHWHAISYGPRGHPAQGEDRRAQAQWEEGTISSLRRAWRILGSSPSSRRPTFASPARWTMPWLSV